MRVVIMLGCRNPGSHPETETPETLAGYSDLQPDATKASDVDWYASEFERLAEQTLSGARSF